MSVTLLMVGMTVGSAMAQPRYRTERVDDDDHVVTLSMSPLHLVVPMFEATGEFRVGESQSVAAIVGIGRDKDLALPLYEVGAQVRQYVIGDFDTGVNLGAEAKYANADYLGYSRPQAMVGPFVGGKLTVALFSLELQGGGQVIWEGEGFSLGPLFNVQAGVSF